MTETKTADIRETANLTKLMITFSVPCIISLLVGALYNIVDQFFIANADYLGSYGNAANNVVYPLTVLALAIAVTFGDGEGSFLSISLGAKDDKNAARSLGSVLAAILIISLVITGIYTFFRGSIILLFGGGVNTETFNLANDYLTWITAGIPFYMFGQAMAAIVSADGSPRYTMATTMFGCLINVILDPLFIYVFHMGMKGAAIATIAGQIVVAFIFLLYLPRMKSVHLDKDCFRMRVSLLKRIVPLGMNSFFAQASIVLSMAVVNNMAAKYGGLDPVFSQVQYAQIPTAVIGIVMKFFQIVISIAIGISAGALPVVGYNVGARRNDRVLGILKRILLAEAAIGLTACLIFEVFPNQLIALFGSANESAYYTAFAVRCIRIFLSLIALSCLNKGTMIFLQAMGRARMAISISVLREIVLGVGLPLLLPVFFGLDGLLFFMPLADIITAMVAGLLLRKIVIDLRNQPEQPPAQAVIREEQPVSHLSENPLTDFVITIDRSYGSGGRNIGRMLAEKLQIPFYDGELLQKAAEEGNMNQKIIESFDEKPTVSDLFLYGSARSFSYSTNHVPRSEEKKIRQAQREVIEKIAAEGPCVIIGRRADQILPEEGTFRIFLSACRPSRIARTCERENLSEAQSARKVDQSDRERAAYYNQYGEKRWGYASNYDLCVDTDKFGDQGTVNMIAHIVKRTSAPQNAA